MGTRVAAAAVLLLPAILSCHAEPPPRLASYELAEGLEAMTPAGPWHRSLSGTVRVLGEDRRWDLVRGTLPRSSVTAVLGSRGELTFVDREAKLSARSSASMLRDLFRAARGDERGLAAVRVGEVEAALSKASGAAPFDGRPAERRRLTFAYTLTIALPGRIQRTRVTGSGAIDTIDEPAAAWPEVDDLRRLLDVPPEVDERLADALARLPGLPVSVTVETRAETNGETVGIGAPPEGLPRPPVTTTKATRRLSALSVRRAEAGDPALFRLPDDVRSVGIERLVESPGGPR